MKRILSVVVIMLLFAGAVAPAVFAETDAEKLERLKAEIEELSDRMDSVEKKSAMDKLNFSGDYRFEATNIEGYFPAHYDGMVLQNMMIGAMFYYGATAMFPASTTDISNFIAGNYADWLYFSNSLSFQDLKSMMAMFPPAMQDALMGMLLPAAYTDGYQYDNEIFYTNKLRLAFSATVSENVSFSGRLSMYKAWGDSTGVQVFNGQPNSMNIDETSTSVPTGDYLRVERAYFVWKNMFDLPMCISPSEEDLQLEDLLCIYEKAVFEVGHLWDLPLNISLTELPGVIILEKTQLSDFVMV